MQFLIQARARERGRNLRAESSPSRAGARSTWEGDRPPRPPRSLAAALSARLERHAQLLLTSRCGLSSTKQTRICQRAVLSRRAHPLLPRSLRPPRSVLPVEHLAVARSTSSTSRPFVLGSFISPPAPPSARSIRPSRSPAHLLPDCLSLVHGRRFCLLVVVR